MNQEALAKCRLKEFRGLPQAPGFRCKLLRRAAKAHCKLRKMSLGFRPVGHEKGTGNVNSILQDKIRDAPFLNSEWGKMLSHSKSVQQDDASAP